MIIYAVQDNRTKDDASIPLGQRFGDRFPFLEGYGSLFFSLIVAVQLVVTLASCFSACLDTFAAACFELVCAAVPAGTNARCLCVRLRTMAERLTARIAKCAAGCVC